MKTILLALVVFGLIIMLHEFGHFLFAKLFRVRVEEFSIGFGPKLLSGRKGETRYSLRAIPFGGYVAMEGEDSAGSGSLDDLTGKEAVEQAAYRDPRTGPFCDKPAWQRFIILAAGATMNVILGFIFLLIITNSMELLGTNVVSDFKENAVSAQYLQSGDKISRVNGIGTGSYNDVIYQILRDEDCTVDFTVTRGGEKRTVSVPFSYETNEDGTRSVDLDLYFLGKYRSFGNSIPYAANWTVSVVKQVWFSLTDLIGGRYGINELSGPVGTVTIIEQASQRGWDSLAMMIAFITINVGVFNLLPIPGLDGGRLLFIFIELLRGKPVPSKYEGIIHGVGLALLFGLILVVSFNDVLKLLR